MELFRTKHASMCGPCAYHCTEAKVQDFRRGDDVIEHVLCAVGPQSDVYLIPVYWQMTFIHYNTLISK